MIVIPGVLQPVAATGVGQHTISSTDMQVFPSPVVTTLFLQPAFSGGGSLQYSLYDAAGKLVLSHKTILKTDAERQSIEMEHIAAGQYILQVAWVRAGTTYTAGYKVQKLQ